MELQTQIFPAVCDAVREAGAFLDDRSLSEQVRSKAATDYVTMADTTVQAGGALPGHRLSGRGTGRL